MLDAKKAAIIRVAFAAALLLFLATSVGISSPVQKAEGLENPQQPADCSSILKILVEEEGSFLENLTNPVLTSETQVQERVDFYREVKPCLSDLEGILPTDDLELVETLVDRFLILVGGVGQRIDLVDLATTNDAAVVELRDNLGLSPPKGLIYISYFDYRYELPKQLAWAFKKPEIAAITLPCRFIVVLKSPELFPIMNRLFPGQVALSKEDLERTISHEFVHAYLLAQLGAKKELPKWFHEAVAVYFSEGAKELSVNYTFGDVVIGTVSAEAPEKYKEYDVLVRYLLFRFGEQGFYETIKVAVETGSVEEIFQKTGSHDFEDLFEKAQEWEENSGREKTIRGIMIGEGFVLMFVVVLFISVWRRETRK